MFKRHYDFFSPTKKLKWPHRSSSSWTDLSNLHLVQREARNFSFLQQLIGGAYLGEWTILRLLVSGFWAVSHIMYHSLNPMITKDPAEEVLRHSQSRSAHSHHTSVGCAEAQGNWSFQGSHMVLLFSYNVTEIFKCFDATIGISFIVYIYVLKSVFHL